jgi:hypothetical protein
LVDDILQVVGDNFIVQPRAYKVQEREDAVEGLVSDRSLIRLVVYE